MTANADRSKKRAATDMEGGLSEASREVSRKKQKNAQTTQVKVNVGKNEPQKLKNIPKFLHSSRGNAYFSKQWWKEMLVKDELWRMLDGNLTQKVRNKRLRANINAGSVKQQQETTVKRQAKPKVTMKPSTTRKKALKKRGAPSVNAVAETANVEVCEGCGEQISPGEPSYSRLQGKTTCGFCNSVSNDGPVPVSKTDDLGNEEQANRLRIGPSVTTRRGSDEDSLATPAMPSSFTGKDKHNSSLSQSSIKNESGTKTPSDVEKQNKEIDAALKAFNSKVAVNREQIPTE